MKTYTYPIVALVLLQAAAAFAAPEVVTVDFSRDRGAATQRASGFLHAMSRTTPPPAMVDPLKPHMFRMRMHSGDGESGAVANYERIRKLGSMLQVVMSDSHGYGMAGYWPGDNDDWSRWETTIEWLVKEAQQKGYVVQWDVWNEPDIKYFWGPDRDRFFETWRRSVKKIRSLDPKAVIVGPSIAGYNTKFLTDFLLFAKQHDVVPTILAWHEMGSYKNIVAHTDEMRKVLAENGIDIRRFSINEMIGPNIQTRPGITVRFFEAIERAGIESAAHACWGDEAPDSSNCDNYTLDGIVTPNECKPRSTWWAYKAYADVTGRLVEVKPSETVGGIAGYDARARQMRVVLGRHGGETGNVDLHLAGFFGKLPLLAPSGTAMVRIERIPDSGWKHLPAPVLVSESDISIAKGEVKLTLPDFGPSDAYVVIITGR